MGGVVDWVKAYDRAAAETVNRAEVEVMSFIGSGRWSKFVRGDGICRGGGVDWAEVIEQKQSRWHSLSMGCGVDWVEVDKRTQAELCRGNGDGICRVCEVKVIGLRWMALEGVGGGDWMR